MLIVSFITQMRWGLGVGHLGKMGAGYVRAKRVPFKTLESFSNKGVKTTKKAIESLKGFHIYQNQN